MIRVRSLRSARMPPRSANIQKGAFIAKASRPRRNEEPPMLSNSQGSATDCIQVPMLERRLANQKTPNRLVRSSLAVWELSVIGLQPNPRSLAESYAAVSAFGATMVRSPLLNSALTAADLIGSCKRENRITFHRACGSFSLHDNRAGKDIDGEMAGINVGNGRDDTDLVVVVLNVVYRFQATVH